MRQILGSTKPPLSFYSSDGRILYVDHPEQVIVSEGLIAIGSAMDENGALKEIVLLNPDHINRIERTKRKALPRAA